MATQAIDDKLSAPNIPAEQSLGGSDFPHQQSTQGLKTGDATTDGAIDMTMAHQTTVEDKADDSNMDAPGYGGRSGGGPDAVSSAPAFTRKDGTSLNQAAPARHAAATAQLMSALGRP